MDQGVALLKRYKGFTTVELLVAMGLLVLLMGILVVGAKVVFSPSKAAATKVQLEVARAMVAEMEAHRGMDKITGLYAIVYMNPIPAPGKVEREFATARRDAVMQVAMNGSNPTRGNTFNVMRLLASLPNNRQAIGKIPADQTERVTNPLNQSESTTVLLDGWGNPIIFVPPGGLTNVITGGSVRKITSVGALNVSTPTSLSARPFFASAGPDGVFGYVDVNGNGSFDPGQDIPGGDDNIYSFGN